MLDIIIGGSASGKSSYGEGLANAYYQKMNSSKLNIGNSDACNSDVCDSDVCDSDVVHSDSAFTEDTTSMYYVATMMAFDEESKKRIKKHQEMRKDKDFETIECFYSIGTIKESIQNNKKNKTKNIFLIECMSNLLANEIYAEKGHMKGTSLEEQKKLAEAYIIEPIIELSKNENRVILITNEIFSDGNTYEKETEDYITLLGYINASLSKEAEHVTEVVCSIPVPMKGTLPC